jgi:nucleoside-diphosphate-sugar epimerase
VRRLSGRPAWFSATYRAQATTISELAYHYEKTLMERVALGAADLPATVLRLPKVYGPGSNADLATAYQAPTS